MVSGEATLAKDKNPVRLWLMVVSALTLDAPYVPGVTNFLIVTQRRSLRNHSRAYQDCPPSDMFTEGSHLLVRKISEGALLETVFKNIYSGPSLNTSKKMTKVFLFQTTFQILKGYVLSGTIIHSFL